MAVNGKLTTDQLRDRLAPVPREVEIARGEQALERADHFIDSQKGRPLARACYLQELNDEDGRFLTQVLERLSEEIQVLTLRGVNREIALCLTSVQQAHHWALEHGRRTGSHVTIDRRIFRTDKENDGG